MPINQLPLAVIIQVTHGINSHRRLETFRPVILRTIDKR
jgi:hypothetical protein